GRGTTAPLPAAGPSRPSSAPSSTRWTRPRAPPSSPKAGSSSSSEAVREHLENLFRRHPQGTAMTTDYNESLDGVVQAAHRQTRQAARDAARKLEEEIARVDRELAAVADELRTQTDQSAIMRLLDKQADLNL